MPEKNFMRAVITASLLWAAGCGDAGSDGQASGSWSCEVETNGWRRCGANGRVEYCHGTRFPHFHNAERCADAGLECREFGDGKASCVTGQSCAPGASRCDGGKAYNCVDGIETVETCGTLQVCSVEGGAARCALAPDQEVCGGHGELHVDHCDCEPGYAPDPQDPLTCVATDQPQPEECGGHGHLHDGVCACDAGFVPDPQDPLKCVAEQPAMGQTLSFTPTVSSALWGLDGDGKDSWIYKAQSGTSAQITIENLVGFGANAQPGAYAISAADQGYDTCGFCVVLETGCSAHDDHLHCAKTYMPKAGNYRLTQLDRMVGGRFAGKLEGVVFQQVTIDNTTLKTTPVAGAPELRMSMDMVWSAPLRAAQDPNAQECSGHGHLHGDTCHCDPGYRLDPQDKGKCIPS